ncbi:HNH endonuclease [Maricaulis sp.]|uniref:HNH endonuclease n=1 Tax=Maricaulis sp. TaxID=1486257 RepID=UPI003A8D88DB
MTRPRTENYYTARGFSIYYIANAVFNVASTPSNYIRGIEELLGDMRTLTLMRPFAKYTNLHNFIYDISIEILTEEIGQEDGELHFIRQFLSVFNVDHSRKSLEDEEEFWHFVSESDRFYEAIEELADEVFHILFNDVGFLQKFNRLCADYVRLSGFGEEHRTKLGALKRVRIPMWARRAIFHRDKGECRACKRSLTSLINNFETERYDHIVPLARFGTNDVTNLQLLCERCNLEKSSTELPVSPLYLRAIRP